MKELIQEYLDYLYLKKNSSSNTLAAYKRDLLKFSLYLEEAYVSDVKEVSFSHIEDYIQRMLSEKRSKATVSRNIVSIKGFFRYLEVSGNIKNNPAGNLKSIKVEYKVPVVLTIKEVETFLEQPDKSDKGIRDKAMLELLYATGIRVSELINLSLDDINLSIGYIQCTDTKNSRTIPINHTCRDSIRNYLDCSRQNLLNKNKTKKDQTCIELFINSRGCKLTRQGFWKIVKGYAESAEINKEITPYMIRHSFACHLVQNGADLKSVQEMMGHESIVSTQVYAKMGNRLNEVYKKAHPRR